VAQAETDIKSRKILTVYGPYGTILEQIFYSVRCSACPLADIEFVSFGRVWAATPDQAAFGAGSNCSRAAGDR
jgi:hypothetical protein